MIEAFIHIEQGKISNSQVLKKALSELKDGRYLIKIEKNNHRTLLQNSYIHAVLFPLVLQGLKDAGFDEVKTREDAKTVCKSLFLKRTIASHGTGEVIEIIKDTSSLSTVEMAEFIEDVIKWGAEYLNIQIPYPNEQTKAL